QMHVASTRNPNQLFSFRPVAALDRRDDVPSGAKLRDRPMLATHTTFLPGSLYIHDLAMIGGRLFANAVGQNAVVTVTGDGRYRRAWWPRSIERKSGAPAFGRNYIQLNSI